MVMRGIFAAAVALLLAVQVVRNAMVTAYAETQPDVAARGWAAHPATETALAMTDIARSARAGHPVPQSAFAALGDVAAKEPLAPEPFLVQGVKAELAGDGATAQRAFEAAQWRDPRSLPAAYFLADRYFRAGDASRGLREVAALSRLAPYGPATIGPYLAGYASNAATWPELRRLLRANPDLAQRTLVALASNVATVPAVLALADPRDRAKEWLPPLLSTLIGSGQYAKARAIWASLSGAPKSGELLHDASFKDKVSSPPFNWALTSSGVGIAERQAGGRLHVVFYGQEDGFLASQLLLLPPGNYQLSLQLQGGIAQARALSWSIWCDKAVEPLASATLDATAARGLRFSVPAGCTAQWVKLAGSSSDMAQQSDVTIAALKLEKGKPGA